MSGLEKIDPNFTVGTELDREDIQFFNVLESPFKLYGVTMEDGMFRRMPAQTAAQVSQSVQTLHTNTAGGRVRFKTDSGAVAISAKIPTTYHGWDFALSGAGGFDLYEKTEDGFVYRKTFMSKVGKEGGYESIAVLGEQKERELLIHFPTYSDVSSLYIGIEGGASLTEATAYKYTKPFVCYGSSITQGGCASRSGNAYASILSRRFDIDHINLGFSGGARAEDAIADYIANMDMSFFIYDYDYNASSDEYYEQTHEKLFKKVRAKHPTMPILILPRPRYIPDAVSASRSIIARRTYENAVAAGDKRVWFIDGKQLMALCKSEGTVDDCHPTDYGFHSMAKAIGDWMEEVKLLEMI